MVDGPVPPNAGTLPFHKRKRTNQKNLSTIERQKWSPDLLVGLGFTIGSVMGDMFVSNETKSDSHTLWCRFGPVFDVARTEQSSTPFRRTKMIKWYDNDTSLIALTFFITLFFIMILVVIGSCGDNSVELEKYRECIKYHSLDECKE